MSREASVRLVGSLFFPDLMGRRLGRPMEGQCFDIIADKKDRVWLCSRSKHHSGRHAAGDGDIILAVWPRKAGQ